MHQLYQGTISTDTREHAESILDALLSKKIIICGMIIRGLGGWRNQSQLPEKREIYSLTIISVECGMGKVIELVEDIHGQSYPPATVTFTKIEVSNSLLEEQSSLHWAFS